MAKNPKTASSEPGGKSIAVTLRGTQTWKEWVERGAAHCRTDVAKLIDAALVDYLKAKGFDEEAPPR